MPHTSSMCESHRIAAFLLTICFMVCPSGTAPLSQSQFNTPSQYTLTLTKHLQRSLKMQGSLRYTDNQDITQCNCTYWSGFLLNDTTQLLLLTGPNIFILSSVGVIDNHDCHTAGRSPQSCVVVYSAAVQERELQGDFCCCAGARTTECVWDGSVTGWQIQHWITTSLDRSLSFPCSLFHYLDHKSLLMSWYSWQPLHCVIFMWCMQNR